MTERAKPDVIRAVAIYCSSSEVISEEYFSAARKLGAETARRGLTLVFGGCSVGLMGAVAASSREQGGHVIGVVPEAIHSKGITDMLADEVIITHNMRDRKATIEARADAFIALPGGFGTLEEVLEILTLKQLQYHSKPLVLLNVRGFYDPLKVLFEHVIANGFAKAAYRELYHFSETVEDAFQYLADYSAPHLPGKWSTPACEAE